MEKYNIAKFLSKIMRRKNTIIVFIILIFCIIPLKNAKATTSYLITDQSFDVDYYQDGIFTTSGAFHPEIDIVSFEIQLGKMVALFENSPLNDSDHIYTILILWNSNTTNLNKTYLQYGSGINSVQTTLYTDTGAPIIINTTLDIVISGIDNVESQIPNFNLISNLFNPAYVEIDAKFIVVQSLEFYQDKLIDDNLAESTPGFQILNAVVGLVIIVYITASLKKRRYC